MCLFKIKKIVKVEIIGLSEGISEDDEFTNLAAGHMMGGLDGLVQGPTTTTFLILGQQKLKLF